jgi:Phage integrase family
VFPNSQGGHLRRHNWRRRVWIPALERAGVPYVRSYDLRHTCATLLLYEGRTLNEVAEHLGHADPGFTARTYAHVMRDAPRRRRITISEAIRKGRVAASRRPQVDPSDAKRASRAARSEKKSLQLGEADARTRTGDPFITSEVLYQLSYVGSGCSV